MVVRTPFEAYTQFQRGLNEALSCVTAGRLSVPSVSDFREGFEYAAVLNRGVPANDLRSNHRLSLTVVESFVITSSSDAGQLQYRIETSEYSYQILTRAGSELLAFHWTPFAVGPEYRTHSHLHVGNVLLDDSAPIQNFHKLHIPTGRIPLSSVIRLLIEEFGVQPRRENWREMLIDDQSESW